MDSLDRQAELRRAQTARYRAAHPGKAKEWKAANPERVRETKRAWVEANRERVRQKAREHYHAKKDLYRASVDRNRESIYERNRVYRAAKRAASRVPASMVQRKEINHVYAVARAWRTAGIAVHVDHIVPLRGRLVSGLHVLANLTVVPASVNLSKGNRHV